MHGAWLFYIVLIIVGTSIIRTIWVLEKSLKGFKAGNYTAFTASEEGDFYKINDTFIQLTAGKLNHQPRKYLNFRTPYEVLLKTKTLVLRT